MKKKYFFILSLFIISSFLFINNEKSFAETDWWGNPNSKWVTQIANPSTPNFNVSADTVQLSFSPEYTTYSTNLKSTQPFKNADIGSNGKTFSLKYGETLRITNSGRYKGNVVDLAITNINDDFDTASITVMPDGRVTSYINAYQTNGYGYTVKTKKQFYISILDSSTGKKLSNVPILFTQTQLNQYTTSLYAYGFDLPSTKQVYALKSAVDSDSAIYANNYNNNLFLIDDLGGKAFDYAYYGQTDSYGNLNMYVGTMFSNKYAYFSIYNPDPKKLLYPTAYLNTNSSVDSKTTDAGKYIKVTTKQQLVVQNKTNFYPKNNTFKFNLKESNVDYLSVKEDDFTLYADNTKINKNEYSVSITQNTASNISIAFDLKGSFAQTYAGKTLTVEQKSVIKPDESIIKSKLSNSTLPIGISTELTYTLNNGVQSNPNVSVVTNQSDFSFLVEPEISATVVDGYTTSDSSLNKISIDELVKNRKNTYFPWDNVTATYQTPNQVLNSGSNTVKMTLKSSTFSATKAISTTVDLVDGYTLTYKGNGGTINGKEKLDVPFTKNGISLIGKDEVVREGYDFIGWSKTETATNNLLKSGYIFGLIGSEQTDTTLYAMWKKQTKLSVSWEKNTIQTNLATKVDKYDSLTSVNYYWNSDVDGSEFLVKMTVGNKSTDLKTIKQNGTSTALKEDKLEISTKDLPYGETDVLIEFFEVEETISTTPKATLNLKVDIYGSLRFESVPDNLSWTDRYADKAIGILDRDQNNDIDISVIDSRKVTDNGWKVNTNVTILDDSFPFDFVWKNSLSDTSIPFYDLSIIAMDSVNVTKEGNFKYTKKWAPDLGILLNARNKVAAGDYSGEAIVNWILCEDPY